MVVTRERSGRSGRRRGSQKPGTCTIGSATLAWACAFRAVSGASSNSDANASAPPSSAKAGRNDEADDIMVRCMGSGGNSGRISWLHDSLLQDCWLQDCWLQDCWLHDSCSAAFIAQLMPPPRWLFRLEAGFLDHALPARQVF